MQLTIEELRALKVGDWVWIVIKKDKSASYWEIYESYDEYIILICGDQIVRFDYSDYGTKWIAYKNKEDAERSLPDIHKKCCTNCRNKGLAENKCDKLTKLFEENDLQYEQGIYPSSIDRWTKRHNLMEGYCCDDYANCWLEFPIAVTEIKVKEPIYNRGLGHKVGQLVKVRPCGKEYENKTYLGFYLGDLPISINQAFDSKTHILDVFTHSNPAIFIPQLGKIVFGCESWWGEIDNPDELKDITDECINNQWYVKALQELNKKGLT